MKFELNIQKIGERLGLFWFTILVTLLSMTLSALLNLTLSVTFWDKISFDSTIRSIVIPGVIAPGLTYFFVKVLLRMHMAEENLRKSEEKYRSVLEGIEEGYYEVDVQGHFTFFNGRIPRMLGYPSEELMGMHFRHYMDRENAEKVYTVFNHVFRTQRPTRAFDWQLLNKEGGAIHIEASVSLVSNSKGEPVGFRGIIRDITERKRAEKEKEHLEMQLQHAQRMESVGTLAGGIAHDFNNLLMGIQGNVSLMLLSTDSGDERHSKLKKIESAVERGARLTQQLLGFAREGKFQSRVVNPNTLVEDTANMFGRTRKQIAIHKELSEQIAMVEVDATQIEQVLINLFVNAGQAMGKGGELFIETENVDLEKKPNLVHGLGLKKYVRISVTDSGEGMDEFTRQRVFDPFYTTRGVGKGTGMGLALSYGIIKNHGGTITVKSRKGRGSTFDIYLPARQGEEPNNRPESEDGNISKGSGTILLVDDEELVLETGAYMLRELGYEAIKARSGHEALNLYESKRAAIDLVIIDMIMPRMSGRETFEAIREIDPDIPILLTTGYGSNGRIKEIMEMGCDGYFHKPLRIEQLSEKIRAVLARLKPDH